MTTRPRYARLCAAGGSALVTLVAILGGSGLIPVSSAAQRTPDRSAAASTAQGRVTASATPQRDALQLSGLQTRPEAKPSASSSPGTSSDASTSPAVPVHSGTGRRIVFDMAAQRVWLVGLRSGHDAVRRTYLVSGSVTDNLGPGTYAVYSRSRHAVGIDDSGTMQYMVRFTHGDNAAIGFHDIPVDDGSLVQSRADLGTAQSHGCIRQWRPDAQALWRFAPVGTKVVVV